MEEKDNNDIYKVLMSYLRTYSAYAKFVKQNNPTISLLKINNMIDELNAKYKTDFKATKDWFPHWVQDGVID